MLAGGGGPRDIPVRTAALVIAALLAVPACIALLRPRRAAGDASEPAPRGAGSEASPAAPVPGRPLGRGPLRAAARARGARRRRVTTRAAPAALAARPLAVVGDYVRLTKPRIISLLLVTTAGAMFVAAEGVPDGWLLLWTMVGGYLAAGGANAINHYIDRDIDGRMSRTTERPVVAGRVAPTRALAFGVALGVLSAVVLGVAANWLAAALALLGLGLYVGVYTLWLKRTSVHNIVIGGSAGAVPPLVGWAAVTGELGLSAWLLFAIVFYWTPPHFWALALILERDYAAAGIPMLPVVRGVSETKRQILLWTAIMVAVTLLPVVSGAAGAFYLVSALALGAVFLVLAWLLDRDPGIGWSRATFHYSLLYLALIFVALVIDAA
jgi:heme o synthase